MKLVSCNLNLFQQYEVFPDPLLELEPQCESEPLSAAQCGFVSLIQNCS